MLRKRAFTRLDSSCLVFPDVSDPILGTKVRLLIEEQLPFDQFISRLVEARLIAPCYLTVVGTEEAVVVTRGKLAPQACR